MATPSPASFAHLLEQAVNEPGTISAAYSAFHDYSIGNQLLAWSQCLERGIQPGPIATFQRWKELGRYVRKREKAITLCRPVTVKRAVTADDDGTEEIQGATWFVYKPFWFVLAQTRISVGTLTPSRPQRSQLWSIHFPKSLQVLRKNAAYLPRA
jgi:N-terminal domain of anti-restriction factor ArdC